MLRRKFDPFEVGRYAVEAYCQKTEQCLKYSNILKLVSCISYLNGFGDSVCQIEN